MPDLEHSPNTASPLPVATEARYAERFAALNDGRLCYQHRRGIWLIYDPPLWRPDLDG